MPRSPRRRSCPITSGADGVDEHLAAEFQAGGCTETLRGLRRCSSSRSQSASVRLVRVTKLPCRSSTVVVVLHVEVLRMPFGSPLRKQKKQLLLQRVTSSHVACSNSSPRSSSMSFRRGLPLPGRFALRKWTSTRSRPGKTADPPHRGGRGRDREHGVAGLDARFVSEGAGPHARDDSGLGVANHAGASWRIRASTSSIE